MFWRPIIIEKLPLQNWVAFCRLGHYSTVRREPYPCMQNTCNKAQSSAASFRPCPFGYAMTLSAPGTGTFPAAYIEEQAPCVCWLRGRASPASSAVVNGCGNLQTPSSQRVYLQEHCQKLLRHQNVQCLFAWPTSVQG